MSIGQQRIIHKYWYIKNGYAFDCTLKVLVYQKPNLVLTAFSDGKITCCKSLTDLVKV